MLRKRKKKKAWSVWHDVIYIHLVLAHAADDELNDEELATIVEAMYEWLPEKQPAEMAAMVHDVMQDYTQKIDMVKLKKAIASVRDQMPPEQRHAVLTHLTDIARADGDINENEQIMLKRLQDAWGVPHEGIERIAGSEAGSARNA